MLPGYWYIQTTELSTWEKNLVVVWLLFLTSSDYFGRIIKWWGRKGTQQLPCQSNPIFCYNHCCLILSSLASGARKLAELLDDDNSDNNGAYFQYCRWRLSAVGGIHFTDINLYACSDEDLWYITVHYVITASPEKNNYCILHELLSLYIQVIDFLFCIITVYLYTALFSVTISMWFSQAARFTHRSSLVIYWF